MESLTSFLIPEIFSLRGGWFAKPRCWFTMCKVGLCCNSRNSISGTSLENVIFSAHLSFKAIHMFCETKIILFCPSDQSVFFSLLLCLIVITV